MPAYGAGGGVPGGGNRTYNPGPPPGTPIPGQGPPPPPQQQLTNASPGMIPGWMGQGPPPGYAMAEDNSMVPNSFYGGGGGAAPADPIQQLIAVLMRQAQMPAASGSQIKPSLLTGPFLQYLMQNGLMGGGGGAGGGIGGGGSGRLTPY